MVEPEFNLFIASLLFGWHLEKVDFDFFAMVEVFNNGVSEFGEGAWANVAADVFVVFIHEKENVGAFEILEEGNVNVSEIFGVVTFGRNDAWIINDFVATTFKIASPVGGAFLEFRTSCDDEFLHIAFILPQNDDFG